MGSNSLSFNSFGKLFPEGCDMKKNQSKENDD